MGETPMLLKSQREELFVLIVNHMGSPIGFEIDQKNLQNDDYVRVRYQKTLGLFMINLSQEGNSDLVFNTTMSPGREISIEYETSYAWSQAREKFKEWLNCLKREISAGDPWKEFEEQRAMAPTLVAFNQTANKPFSYPEVLKLEASIQQLKDKMDEMFTEKNTAAINLGVQLESLISAAKSGRGRIDWTNQLVGLIISTMMLLAATPSQAHLIWGFIKGILGGGLFLH